MHLLLAFAAWQSAATGSVLPPAHLPHLQTLLARLAPGEALHGDAESLTPPHERARAQALGLSASDGCLPWASLAASAAGLDPGLAWAWISPAHWEIGATSVRMTPPAHLLLRDDESQQLMASALGYFAQDGIGLHWQAADRWLACSPLFEQQPCASIDRVAGQALERWMPTHPLLRRLMSEMQMLFYQHPVNDERLARGALPVNAFWVHGCGRRPDSRAAELAGCLIEPAELRDAALADDPQAWLQAWQRIDERDAKSLCRALDAGDPTIRLTLCDAAGSRSFGPRRRGALARLHAALRPPSLARWQETP